MLNLNKRMPSQQELPFVLLLIVGIMEFVYISLESLFSYIGYYLVEDYIIVPCLVFVGIALTRKLTPHAKRQLQLAGIAVAWFTVVQVIHKLSGMGTHPIGTVFFVYLMAFPFASVTEDQESRGLNLIGGMLLAASMVQVFYALLLVLDWVPEMMADYVYWDGARLHVFWHSNITACFLMVGIGMAVSFLFQARARKWKVLMAVLIVLQFVAMALTNCRTTLLMTSAFLGSIGFFHIYKGGWKKLVIGVVTAAVVMAASFWMASQIFDMHNEKMENRIAKQIEVIIEQNGKLTTDDIDKIKEDTTENFSAHAAITRGEIVIFSNSGQGTLSGDMRTLNGRTGIWKNALTAIRDNKKLALWGTEYVDVTISVYNSFEVQHAHNSWMETLLRQGVPGLLLALVFTCVAVRAAWVLVWSTGVEIWKKILAVMTMCVMVTGFLEPYLFITNVYYHVIDFIFFFCTGYLDLWRKQLKDLE